MTEAEKAAEELNTRLVAMGRLTIPQALLTEQFYRGVSWKAEQECKECAENARIIGMSGERELALRSQLEQKEAEIARLRETLEFYAKNKTAVWERRDGLFAAPPMEIDQGQVAKKTLSQPSRAHEKWKAMERVVEAVRKMDDLLHLRLRYCPEAQWLEEQYFRLKEALADLDALIKQGKMNAPKTNEFE